MNFGDLEVCLDLWVNEDFLVVVLSKASCSHFKVVVVCDGYWAR